MEETWIRSASDLERLPNADERAAHIGDDSEGSPKARHAIARLIATWNQKTVERIDPDPLERLPLMVDETVAVLDSEDLELSATVMEPGVHHITNTIGTLVQVMDATLVRIRFVARARKRAMRS